MTRRAGARASCSWLSRDTPLVVPIEDPFPCLACGQFVPAAGACRHLRDHEEALLQRPIHADSEADRDQLVRTLRAHSRMRLLGQCFCAAENPKMRGAER